MIEILPYVRFYSESETIVSLLKKEQQAEQID